MTVACAGVSAPVVPKPVASWGDSLTDGVGMDSNYPSQLSIMLDRPVYDGGEAGETSTQILARILAATDHASDVEVFWMGRNNFEDPARVKSDIVEAVAHTNRHFIVLSILNGDYPDELRGTAKYTEILALNAELSALFPQNFVDVRSALSGDSDVPPVTLRADELHLNGAGNRIVAEAVASFIRSKGW